MNQKKYFLTSLAMLLAGVCTAAVATKNLRCEYLTNPLGLDEIRPRLSWILTSEKRAEKQTAYQILVASSVRRLESNQGDLWDSGKVNSDKSSQIIYEGQPLVSREDCFWKVRAWDRNGRPGAWSSIAHWEMGLLAPADWKAQWISPSYSASAEKSLTIRHATYEAAETGKGADVTSTLRDQIQGGRLKLVVNNKTMRVDPAKDVVKRLRVEYEYNGKVLEDEVGENQTLVLPESSPVPILRKAFVVPAKVQHAVLYASALGLYEVHLNGQRVGDHVLAPDWTDYRKRVCYQAYDVTGLLNSGGNAIAAMLADGWFSGHIGNGGFEYFGKEPAFLAQLEITYSDGHTEEIVTDETWKFHDSAIVSSDFMLGEAYDSRLEIKNWDKANLDDRDWGAVRTRDESARKLEAQVMPPVREVMELKPKAVSEPKPGTWVYDLGQNMVGVVRLKVSAPAGTKITVRHAEMLNTDGTLYTRNLRGAPSVDHYVCKGSRTETWQPRFTFHGFRYVEISGLTGHPKPDAVSGVVIASDLPRVGDFACSDPRINQLQSNIQWGQRGNYVSVPTDCPQRDERLGWMGDAEVFIRTATYNADIAAFFTKWMMDVDDGQSSVGAYGDVSPNTMGGKGTPAWADAGIICPWTIYQTYGDKRILETHLPAMTRWVEYMREHSTKLIRDTDRGSDYGDWLAIGAKTPKDLIGTAFFAYSTHLLAASYHAVGRDAEAIKYDQLFADIKTAFNKEYVTADGHIKGDTQCGYAMALKFELLPDNLRAKVADYLAADIAAKGNHLSTGFIGVGYLLPVLTEAGQGDAAYRLLMQDSFPSWLFSVKHGATTIWERWDGWTPEKGFQDPGMNSFNHYSLGSCGEYLFGGIGGIRPASPGYDTILIKPAIFDGLNWAKASYDSIHGTIATAWKKEGDQLLLKVTVPVNTAAKVSFPVADVGGVTESGKPISQVKGVTYISYENGSLELEVGSGTYKFAADRKTP